MTAPKLIPPLLGYYTMAGGGTATPWYLAGDILSSNCLVAYQPKGSADYATSKVNLANPGTYDAADGAAYPTWDATNGWMFNGSTQHLICPIPAFIPKNYSMIVRYSNAKTNGFCALAGHTKLGSGQQFVIQSCSTDATNRLYELGNVDKAGNGTSASGVLAIANDIGYFNGTKDVDIGNSDTTTTQYIFYIGARSVSATIQDEGEKYIQAFSVYNTALTPAQVAAVTNTMNAL